MSDLSTGKVKGIMFSPSMAQAMAEGRKTCTRRVVKPQPPCIKGIMYDLDAPWPDDILSTALGLAPSHVTFNDMLEDVPYYVGCGYCPVGKPGDIVVVKETYRLAGWSADFTSVSIEYYDHTVRQFDFTAQPDGDKWLSWVQSYTSTWGDSPKAVTQPGGSVTFEPGFGCPWRPSIFMPFFLGRTAKRIAAINLEPVQTITEADAIAEGVWTASPDMATSGAILNHIGAFRLLWDGIHEKNPKYQWPANPWVWVIHFDPENVMDEVNQRLERE